MSGLLSSENLVLDIESKYNLLKLFVDDMQRYNVVTRKALSEYKGDQKDPVLVGRAPHSFQISARLDFLDFIVTRSTLVVTPEIIAVLWNVLVINAVVVNDKQVLLEWLTSCVEEGRPRLFPVFADGTAKVVFENYLCDVKSMDFATINAKGYDAFETYFCQINHESASLSSTSRRFIAVLDFAKLVSLRELSGGRCMRYRHDTRIFSMLGQACARASAHKCARFHHHNQSIHHIHSHRHPFSHLYLHLRNH